MPWNCGTEKTPESPLDSKEIQPVHPKGNQSRICIGRTDAEAETPLLWPSDAKELTHWKRPWCWERLKVWGEGDNRGWNGRVASLTRWMWVWASSGSWWWTGRPDELQSTASQWAGHDWATEMNWGHIHGYPSGFWILSLNSPQVLTDSHATPKSHSSIPRNPAHHTHCVWTMFW